MKNLKISFLGIALLLGVWGYSQPYAIPGALGFAKNVRGAYAGNSDPRILYVDRLSDGENDSNGNNRGSLRWCLTQSGPRVILFEVSGYIYVDSLFRVTQDCVSIYGQTAPNPGITITGTDVIDFRCNNVVLQHLRFRSSYSGSGDTQIDALSLSRGSNVFIDHCSFSYAGDECLGVSGSFGDNLSVQNCIFSWPLHYDEGKGMLILSGDRISVLRSAFIHCADRTPLANAEGYKALETVNTLAYNVVYYGQTYTAGDISEGTNLNIIGNEWKAGPNSSRQREVVRIHLGGVHPMNSNALFYLYDNYSPKRVGDSEWNGVAFFKEGAISDSLYYKSETPFAGYETDYYSHTVLEDSLTANAGARPWDRDAVDILALQDMVNGTGSWITYQSEAYYPNLAENRISLTPPAAPHADSGNGYTNLEMWVYEMAVNFSDTTNNDTGSSANIVLLTDVMNNGGDVAHYNWLVSNGFDVTKLDIGTTVDMTSPSRSVINQLNEADLVIVGRDANSNKYDGRGQDVIDSITVPVITVNPYGAQWGNPPMWFKNASVSSVSGSSIYLSVADDTIFANSGVEGDSIEYGTGSLGVISPGGEHNGTVIGSVDDDIAIVRFAKNVAYNDSINAKTPLSDRTIFSFDVNSTSFLLTQDGQAAYYAEIQRLLGDSIKPPVYYRSNLSKSSVNDVTGVEIIEEKEFPFELFPNPVRTQLTIGDLKLGARVYVYSLDGKSLVKTVALSRTMNFDFSNYRSGLYIVRIEMNNKSYSSKFIKR